MRLFFRNAAIMAGLAGATLAALLFFARDPQSFGASSIDKRALLRGGPSPRVILVVGSNAALGVDSGRLEQALKMPVVDAAVTYLVGLRFALESARPYLRRGDVVVIMPEYDNFYGLLDGDGAGLLAAVNDDPGSLAALSTREQVERMLASLGDIVKVFLPQRVKALARGGKTDSVYRRGSFDARGDVVAHLDRASPGFDPKALFEGKARCTNCHVPPLYTLPGFNSVPAATIGIDSFQADRSPNHGYRPPPLRGVFTREKGGFFHDGRFPTVNDVVAHFDVQFGLGLSAAEESDLAEYVKSL